MEASSTPFIAVPTTAGTGSEATAVSVLTNTRTGVKKSIRDASHLARLVLLDADLLAGCPPGVVAASGMDAFTQAVESLVSNRATAFTRLVSMEAARLVAGSLCAAWGGNADAAEPLLVGSFLAGVALANARLGLVHGLAHPLGARFGAAHGLACAVCLPEVLEFNRPAIADDYRTLSDLVGGDLIATVRRWNDRFGLASPFAGRPLADADAIVAETLASGSTAANPRPVAAADAEAVLRRLFGRTCV